MRGYKASYNGFCRGFKFEVGQTYEIADRPICCVIGFHFCPIAENVIKYYEPKPDFKLFEVEALGEIHLKDDKCATNKIHIIREITDENELIQLIGFYRTYDQNGNQLTYKDSNANSYEYTYDQNGNILTCKDSNGYSYEYTYDQNGRELTYKDSDGFWSERTYDQNGKLLNHKNSTGYYREYTYDQDGKELTCKDSRKCTHN